MMFAEGNRDLYKWAATIMSSRSFPSSALMNRLRTSYPQKPGVRGDRKPEDRIEPGSPVLIPGLDLLNHRPFAKVTWQWGGESCRLLSNEAIASGCQVYNNYGPKTNEERALSRRRMGPCKLTFPVIIGYGFSLADNPVDHCVLGAARRSSNKKSVRATTVVSDSKHELATDDNERQRDLEPIAQWVRLYHIALDGQEESAKSAPYAFSPHFLHDTTVALSNRRENASDASPLSGLVNFADPALSHSKLKVMCTVTMLLQKQHLDIAQHNANIPRSPNNEKQLHAARYRQTQLHILRTVSGVLLDQLAGLAGLKTPECRDARVIRLEHTLTESPQPLLTDYRAVLNAGLGTRKPEKIKERGYAEHAFTLWVCGLWLWRSSLAACSDAKPMIGLPHGYLHWLKFVDDVYERKPSGEGTVSSMLPPEVSPVSHANRDKENLALGESLLSMVHAAVQKHPTSIYNHPKCTLDLISWFLDIIREESVMVPNLEGKSGEADDELLLFMEYGGNLETA